MTTVPYSYRETMVERLMTERAELIFDILHIMQHLKRDAHLFDDVGKVCKVMDLCSDLDASEIDFDEFIRRVRKCGVFGGPEFAKLLEGIWEKPSALKELFSILSASHV